MLFGILLLFSRGSSKHPSHFSGMETWRPQAVKKLEARIPPNPKQYSGRKWGFALYSRRMWAAELLFPLKIHGTVYLLRQAGRKAKYQLYRNISSNITHRAFCQGMCLRIKHEMNTPRPRFCWSNK